MRKVTPFRFAAAALVLATVIGAQDKPVQENLIAKIDGSLTANGAFEAVIRLTGLGARSGPYREAFSLGKAGTAAPIIFGRFMQNRRFQSAPEIIDADDLQRPVQIRFGVREDNLVLPFQRQASLLLDFLPFRLTGAAQPDGSLLLGHPGKLREEITLVIPAAFALPPASRFSVERPMARYQSERKLDGRTLTIVRELEFKQESVRGSERMDLDSFAKLIQEDQQKVLTLRRVGRLDPKTWVPYLPASQLSEYGLRAYQEKEYEASRQLLERVVQLKPDDLTAWNNLGRALLGLGELDKAQAAYEQQIAINPRDQYAYNNLGLLFEREGRWERAVESFRKQIEVHPGDASAIGNLPRALMHTGRWADAEQASGAAAKAQPNSAQQRANVVVARFCQDKIADARQEIDVAIGARPSAVLLNNVGYYLGECGKFGDLAESYVRRALDQTEPAAAGAINGPISSAITTQNSLSMDLDTYGWLLFKRGETARALGLIRASAALSPRGEVYAHLAQAELKAGHSEEAAIDWREATFLEPGRQAEVPAEIASRLDSIAPISQDRVWFPLAGSFSADLAGSLPGDQPYYFFVLADQDGKVASVRELDTEDSASRRILPALRTIAFAPVQVESKRVQTAHLVRVVRTPGGNVAVSRSVAAEALAIASDLAPDDFAPAPAPPAPTTGVSGDTLKIGNGVSQPKIAQKVEPTYAEEARRAKLQGTVKLSCVIGANGKARDFQVATSLGLGLDEKAIEAVGMWVFQPGLKDGRPVNVFATIEVRFHLLNNSGLPSWTLSRAAFQVPADGVRPIVERVRGPKVARDASPATATVQFGVNAKGAPVDIKIEKASDEGWAHEVSEALREWKFTPGQQGGGPIAVLCTMDFVRAN
jgi:TonB family protein